MIKNEVFKFEFANKNGLFKQILNFEKYANWYCDLSVKKGTYVR